MTTALIAAGVVGALIGAASARFSYRIGRRDGITDYRRLLIVSWTKRGKSNAEIRWLLKT